MKLKPTQFNYRSICFSDSDDYENDDIRTFGQMKQQMKPITFNIDAEMMEAYKRNEGKIQSESIRPISNGIHAWYNSLNILVGPQGCGKTHVMVRDVIQMSRLQDGNFHLIVYISKNGNINDSTFEAQQELIQLPIHVVSDANAEKYLKELDLWKELYDKRVDNEKMFEFLHVDATRAEHSLRGCIRKPLNTIILCEDFVKSKLLKSSYFTNYITQLRHKHAIVYVNVQFFKSIPTEYKQNCTSFFIFSGFSRQKMQYIYQQVPMPLEFDELWYRYSKQKNHDFIVINTRINSISDHGAFQ